MLPGSFMDHVQRTDTCWLWVGSKNNRGYGHLTVNGESRLAHRVAYEHHRGPIGSALEIDHLCRQRACVNPDHLEAVTRQENIKRSLRPECRQGHARITGRPCATCSSAKRRERYAMDPAYRARKIAASAAYRIKRETLSTCYPPTSPSTKSS